MTLAFTHVLQLIDPCAGMQRTTICGLNASRSTHHRNTRQIIGRIAINQHVDLALIVATCITYRITAATIPFVPFEQTNGLPPQLDALTHYLPQAAVTHPRQSPPPPTPHSTQIPSARTSTLGNAGGSTVATSRLQQVQRHLPQGKGVWTHSQRSPLLLASTSWFHPYDRSSSSAS